MSVNIAAVPDTLLEAEFFGVAPGAYTGAERKEREGKFKLADGGAVSRRDPATCKRRCRPSSCARCRSRRSRSAGQQSRRARRRARHCRPPAATWRRW
ncbi:MAG: sigma 54-interacting transcriptional regulator [Rubrivivax sp.]